LLSFASPLTLCGGMASSEVGMLIRSLRSDDATVSRNAACRLKDIYGSSELVASDGAGPSEGQKRLESLWAQNRWTRPPPDGRATIHVAGFGFYPTGPPKPKPAPDPAKAKAKARWKMVAKFLRPGGGTADAGADADVQAVSVRRHSSFNLLPVLKVLAEACGVLSAARCGCGRPVSSCAGADDGTRACRAKWPRVRATRRPATSGFTTALSP
jgi:hypothetical protein